MKLPSSVYYQRVEIVKALAAAEVELECHGEGELEFVLKCLNKRHIKPILQGVECGLLSGLTDADDELFEAYQLEKHVGQAVRAGVSIEEGSLYFDLDSYLRDNLPEDMCKKPFFIWSTQESFYPGKESIGHDVRLLAKLVELWGWFSSNATYISNCGGYIAFGGAEPTWVEVDIQRFHFLADSLEYFAVLKMVERQAAQEHQETEFLRILRVNVEYYLNQVKPGSRPLMLIKRLEAIAQQVYDDYQQSRDAKLRYRTVLEYNGNANQRLH